MTCENNMMGSKKKSTNGILLSVGMWMMISYGTFGMKEDSTSDDNLNDYEKLNKKIPNTNQQKPSSNEGIIDYDLKPNDEALDEKINEKKKHDTIKDDKKKQKVLSTDIINNVFGEDNDLKKCIETIEKNKSEEFTVKHARCCCWSGSIVDAKITDIKGNAEATVKELIKRSLVPDKEKPDYFMSADKVDDSLEVKTGIYDVVANKIGYITDAINSKAFGKALNGLIKNDKFGIEMPTISENKNRENDKTHSEEKKINDEKEDEKEGKEEKKDEDNTIKIKKRKKGGHKKKK
jgi:hypothetical protein